MNLIKPLSQNEAAKRLTEIRAEYFKEPSLGRFSALIQGMPGVGKTTMIATGRRPILIDSFDPRGTLVLRDEIKSGSVFVRPYWDENSENPTEYIRWEKQWREDLKSGFLSLFGTYAIDSLTTFLAAMSNYTAKRKGREKGTLAQGDYRGLYASLLDHVKMTQACDCDFIATAHLVMEMDEIEKRSYAELDVYKGLKSEIPILFTEKFILEVENTSKGPRHVLITSRKGPFRGSSQLGMKGTFNLEEEPNIKSLLKKAGLPFDDKPLLL